MNMWQSEMKILKSKYHKQGYIVMNQKKYKIEILPVNEIWPSVPKAVKHRGKPFYKELTVDIKANGLHFPLLVVNAQRSEVVHQKNIWGKKKILEKLKQFQLKQNLMVQLELGILLVALR